VIANKTYWREYLNSKLILIVLIAISFNLYACMSSDSGEEEELAKVSSQVLKRKDLQKYLPMQFASPEDSTRSVKLFIEQWLSEQVMNEQALGEIDGLEERIEYKVRDYRNKLILNEYYNYLIDTRLDTVIDSVEMNSFYQENIQKFICPQTRYVYLFLGTHLLDIRAPIKLLTAKPEEIQYAELNTWATKNTFVMQTDTFHWAEAEELDGLSASYYGRLRDLRAGHYPVSWTATYDEKPAQYLFKILRVIQTGEILPFWMVQASVKNSIIHERTRKMLTSEQNRIVKEAKDKGNAYVY
jgi:hypothetical protein